MNITHALKWSFLSELAAKIVQPVVFIVLARLLTPEDFGVVAAAMMVISFSQIFWEAGMGKAVIQSQANQNTVANTAFWINNALGIIVAGILIAISNLIADRVFHDPRVGLVLRVMSAQVFLAALGAVHTALLQKEMQFKPLFWVRFATVSFPGLVSIPLALQGMGYWAIVVGTLVGQFMQVVVLWKISSWRPALQIDRDIGRKLIKFGVWVAFSGLLGWFYGWADSLIVGTYLGAKELGLYRTANQFIILIYALMFNPVQPVLYSYLSDSNYDPKQIRVILLKILKIIAIIAIPLGFSLSLSSHYIYLIVFNSKWNGIELAISLLALTHGFTWLAGMNGEVYKASGRPHIETYIMLGCLFVYSFGYFISVRLGLTAFLWTRLALAISTLSIHFYVLSKFLNISINKLVKYPLKVTLCIAPALLLKYLFDLLTINTIITTLTALFYIAFVTVMIARKDIVLIINSLQYTKSNE